MEPEPIPRNGARPTFERAARDVLDGLNDVKKYAGKFEETFSEPIAEKGGYVKDTDSARQWFGKLVKLRDNLLRVSRALTTNVGIMKDTWRNEGEDLEKKETVDRYSGVAHDVLNLLNHLMRAHLNIDLLFPQLSATGELDNLTLESHLKERQKNVKFSRDFVDNLVDLAEDPENLETGEVDLVGLARIISVLQYRPEMPVVVTPLPVDPFVSYPGHIKGMLFNLIKNAQDHASGGATGVNVMLFKVGKGGRKPAELREGELLKRIGPAGWDGSGEEGDVCITVSNPGEVDEETLGKLFETEVTTRPEEERGPVVGGMGSMVVRRALDKLGAKLEIVTGGKQTMLRVFIPPTLP